MSIAAFLPLIGEVIDKIFPDQQTKTEAKLRLFELQQKGGLAELEATTKLALAQIGVNQESARSGHWFVAGARPAVIWICALGLAWNFVAQPIAMWAGAFADPPVAVPTLDISQLMILLGGLLGLGGMRSYDKRNQTETQTIK